MTASVVDVYQLSEPRLATAMGTRNSSQAAASSSVGDSRVVPWSSHRTRRSCSIRASPTRV